MTSNEEKDKGAGTAAKQNAPLSSQQPGCNQYNTEGLLVQFSVITNTAGLLTKEFAIGTQGELQKASHASLYEGKIEVKEIPFDQLQGTLEALETNQAIMLGIPKNPDARTLTTQKNLATGTGGCIARSLEHIVWPEGPRLVLLDIDHFEGARAEMETALLQIIPELDGAALLIRPSVSTCIKDAEGNIILGENKWHIYFVIDPRQDMGALKEILDARCWLNEYGWMESDKPGRKVLSRTIFDLSVLSPERLVFEAPAILGNGLQSFRTDRCAYTPGCIIPSLPPLTAQEQEEVKRRKEEARNDPRLAADMVLKRQVYEPELLARYMFQGWDKKSATAKIKAFYESKHVLLGSVPVFLEKGEKGICAGDLLWNPEKYDQACMLDPEDPTYQDNDRIARFEASMLAFDSAPGIQSFAHGGELYRIKYDVQFIIQKLGQLQQEGQASGIKERLPEILGNMYWNNDQRLIEQESLKHEMKAAANIPFALFNAILKGAEKEAARKSAQKALQDDGQTNQYARSNIENHNDAAGLFLKDHTSTTATGELIRPVGCDGKLYKADITLGLWQGIEQEQQQAYIGDSFRGPKCDRVSDYKSISTHAYNKVSDPSFFSDSPDGVPCGNGFIRIYQDGKVELLGYEHTLRQTTKLKLDGIVLDEWDDRHHLDGYEQLEALKLIRFGGHIRLALGEGVLIDLEVRQQVNALQMAMGGTLGGFLHKTQQALFLKGTGSNGKSVILNVLTELIDPVFITASSPMSWSSPEGLQILVGKRLNIVPELPKNEQLPDGPFKSIIPGDTDTTYRKLYSDQQIFRPRAAHWFGCNNFPKTADKSHGLFRRCFFFEFPHTFTKEEMIADYDQVIFKEEGSVILTWCIEGARKFVEAGYKLPKSARSEILIDRWRNTADSVKFYLSEKPFHQKSGAEVYGDYRRSCMEWGLNPVAVQTFYSELEINGYTKHHDQKLRGFIFTNDKVETTTPNPDDEDRLFRDFVSGQPLPDEDPDFELNNL